jgi:hypothetical protein
MISPSTAVEAAATIIALSAYGVTKIQTEYREHAEKVLTDQMVGIQGIYNESLKDMLVIGLGENAIVSTPAIFIMDEKDPSKPVIKSLVLNDLILKDLADTYPTVNADLLAYGERLHNAMQALRQFYYLRTEKRNKIHKGNKTDLTSSILSYLILMISTHCYKFEGIETTMTYLRGFQKFVQRYGSFGGKGKKSDRYQHMAKVYKELNIAESLLLQYSLTLSYTNYLNLLIPKTTGCCNELLRCALKIITPIKDWDLIEYVNAQDILDGNIKDKFDYAHEGLFGGGGVIPIKESPMKEKLKICAKNYLTAIRSNDDPENKAAFVADDKFSPKFTRNQYQHIMEVVRDCNNFLTLKIKPASNQNLKQWLLTNDGFIDKRINTYQELVGLINKIIVLIYYCAHLSNRVKQLGEIYVTNPHHCVYIFEIFKELGNINDEQVKLLKTSILEITKENGQIMPVAPSQTVYERLCVVLDDIRGNVIPVIKSIYLKHTEHPKSINVDFSKAIKENVSQMITIAKRVADQYGIKTVLSEQVKHEPSPLSRSTPSSVRDFKSDTELKEIKEIKDENETTGVSHLPRSTSLTALAIPHNTEPVIAPPTVIERSSEVKTGEFNEAALNKIGITIHNITFIDPTQAKEYTEIHTAIINLREKCVSLRLEDSLKRQRKGENLSKLLNAVCADFIAYLNQEHNERIYGAENFYKKMKDTLNDASTAYLDVHSGMFTMFNTHSRNLVNKVVDKCEHLARISKAELP